MTVAPSPLSHLSYRPDIDGLRAIAVLAVVLFHAFPGLMQGGFTGVDVFFVISGYLISTIIFSNLELGTFSFSTFYARRIRRIFPALLIVLAVSYAAGWFILLADEYKEFGQHLAAGTGFMSNFVLWNEAGYFDVAGEGKPLLHLWSLALEEQFYIVWPLLLWLASKARLHLLTVTVVLAAISFALNLATVGQDPVAAFYSPQTRFWELLAGGILAKYVHRRAQSELVHASLVSNALSLSGLLLLVLSFWFINKRLDFPGAWALIPVSGAALLILAGPDSWCNRRILSNRFLVGIGLISYPLYLWHWPLLAYVRIARQGLPHEWQLVLAVEAAFVLAFLTYQLIERPVRFGQASRRFAVPTLALLACTLAGIGIHTYRENGLLERGMVSAKSRLIRDLARISNVYEFYDYEALVRTGVCHSVSLRDMQRNKCLDIRAKNIFIWGDSYAASLYSGLHHVRESQFQDVGVSQLTDGNGPPFYLNGKTTDGKTLVEANDNRLALVAQFKPQVIVLSWMVGASNTAPTKEGTVRALTDTIERIRRRSPASSVVVIGPFPKWEGTLRRQLVDTFMQTGLEPGLYMSTGLSAVDRDFDLFFGKELPKQGVKYISSYEVMCKPEGCLTRVGDTPHDLTAVDFGHLTRAGSIFLAEQIKHRVFHF